MKKSHQDTPKLIIDDDGFTCLLLDERTKIKWTKVDKIIAYKTDMFTYDEICLDIFFDKFHITITEEMPGWSDFIDKVRTILPGIPSNWYADVMLPAFATNMTVIYERERQKVFVDFQNSDVHGRVRLNTSGTFRDLKKLNINLGDGLRLLLDDDDGLCVFGSVRYSKEESIWVAEIDWDNLSSE